MVVVATFQIMGLQAERSAAYRAAYRGSSGFRRRRVRLGGPVHYRNRFCAEETLLDHWGRRRLRKDRPSHLSCLERKHGKEGRQHTAWLHTDKSCPQGVGQGKLQRVLDSGDGRQYRVRHRSKG